jgi:hypothetical protein
VLTSLTALLAALAGALLLLTALALSALAALLTALIVLIVLVVAVVLTALVLLVGHCRFLLVCLDRLGPTDVNVATFPPTLQMQHICAGLFVDARRSRFDQRKGIPPLPWWFVLITNCAERPAKRQIMCDADRCCGATKQQ